MIKQLSMRLEGGNLSIDGRMKLKPKVSGQWNVEDHEISINKLLRVAGSPSLPLDLTHSGHWNIQTGAQGIELAMRGRLSNNPVTLSGMWTPEGIQRMEFAWSKPGLASTSLHVTEGKGTFDVSVSSGEFKALVRGNVDVPRRLIGGKGTLEKLAWQGKRLEKIEFIFSADPKHQQVDATVENLQFRSPDQNPFDIQSGQLSVKGLAPRWQSSAALKFRNGSSADFDGELHQGSRFWRLDWRRVKLAFASAGSWTTERPGSVTWTASHETVIRDLYLASGKQTLQVPRAVFGEDYRLSLSAHEIDPGPWATLFMPALSLNDGAVNASIELTSQSSHVHAEGFLAGKIKTLTIVPLGLTLHTIEVDVRSTGEAVEIKRFSGKTKKGDITITGRSHWPDLNYTLAARELMIHPDSFTKATGGAQLHLGGTLESPVVTGHVNIQEEGLCHSAKR